jgi:hypothetical protein
MDQPLFEEVLGAKVGGVDAFFQQIQTYTGVNLSTMTEVWIAVEKKDNALILLKGTFDPQLIASTVLNIDTAQVVQRQGVPFAVTLPDNKHPGQFNLAAVLDEKTMAFGKPELVDTFLAAFKGNGPGLAEDDAARAVAMMKSEGLLTALLLNMPEKEVRKNPWMRLFTHAELVASTTQDDLVIDGRLGLKKPEMREPATKAIEGVRDIYALLDDDLRKLKPMQEMLLEGIKVQPDRQDLVVQLAIPMEIADRMIRQKFKLP